MALNLEDNLKTFSFEYSINLILSCDIVPQFSTQVYIITEFSKKQLTQEVIYSESLFTNGIQWRLKVYPNGNGASKGVYLSIFLEMTEGS